VVEVPLKRCGGPTHRTEQQRMLTLNKFHKNKGNKDGLNRICKLCFKEIHYGDNCKKVKIVPVPNYNKNTHKWCNTCEKVKEYKDFYKDRSTKSGYSGNCKDCREYKRSEKKKNKKE